MLGLVCVDIFILLLWTFLDRPRGVSYYSTAGGLYKPVLFTACSTNLNSPFERAMVAWKAILLGAGVYKSICTWDMPSDIAEVTHIHIHTVKENVKRLTLYLQLDLCLYLYLSIYYFLYLAYFSTTKLQHFMRTYCTCANT